MAGVLVAAMIEDDHSRQPDDVQLAHLRVAVFEAQRNEGRVDRGDHGVIWIHHGIQ